MRLGYDGNMMGDLERQIVCNIASDHQQRLLKSTICRLRQKKKNNNNGECVRNKDSKGKGRGKSCSRVAVY